MMEESPVFAVDGLSVHVGTRRGGRRVVVDNVSFDVRRGETLGIVGESGSGKTLAMLGALGLVPDGVSVASGSAMLLGEDLLRCSKRRLRSLRGREVGVIFQDPLTSLHPSLRIGDQLIEAIRVHDRTIDRSAARRQVVELLRRVEVPRAQERLDDYPHQWSGGMRQRAMIAMAITHDPTIIIADEPTTALDVTVQAQILRLIADIQAETGAALVLISHDLGVIAESADRVVVMYDGRIVERAPVAAIFSQPQHPYTLALLESVPSMTDRVGSIKAIRGLPPRPSAVRRGCPFEPRCEVGRGRSECIEDDPALVARHAGEVACHFPLARVSSS